ncbi:MAG TPA: phosphatidate cytidylyltransferase [Candidatus Cloacimonetes bacterium]|nr:phosphatidate cytidylyltransferase [Candidatus Cloacimonadota bacterium]
MQELAKRLIVSFLFIPILILAIYHGGLPLYLMFLFVSFVGSIEYKKMMENAEIKISTLWLVLNPILFSLFSLYHIDSALIVLIVIINLVIALFNWDEDKSLPRVFSSIYGTLYVAFFPALLYKLDKFYDTKNILLALIIMVWIVDSAAYFIGMRFGKRRNITAVSPRKSLEGFIAGFVASLLVAALLFLNGYVKFSLLESILLCLAAGVFGQLGDLSESMIKRFCKVKDSSSLIPGHGGILDRTDSILLSGSFLYAALMIAGIFCNTTIIQ